MQDKQPHNNHEEMKDGKSGEWRPQDADREQIKQQIRNRVRNAKVSENTVFIPARPEPSVTESGHKTVAAYTRVSTLNTEQVSSIENQTRYYTEKIEKNPDWTLHKIYSDEGKSGTSMRKRTAFQEMMRDARDNKMDLILCASVSRFARNVADCMDQVRELRTQNPSHPVGVYFETENIYTLDPSSHQAFSMHAMLADWESANKSRRMIISYDQRICMGQYPLADGLGYRHTKDGKIVIEEDEAKTVRYIFLSYLKGDSLSRIAQNLTKMGRRTLHGRTEWNDGMVRNIMLNERRWGDLHARKTVVVDYVKGTTVKNDMIRDAAFVSGHHEGIVSPEIARAAHMIMNSSYGHRGGVAEVSVIPEGALKGFVSISPSWGGMDMESILQLSVDVYTPEEYKELERESKLLSGEESARVIAMGLHGYQVPYGAVFINNQMPTLTMSRQSFRFNRKVFERLPGCTHIELLFHPVLKMLAVREANDDNPNAFQWRDGDSLTMKICATAFCKSVYQVMDWIESFRFRFRGISREKGGRHIMLFYLDEPQILPDKATVEQYKIGQDAALLQYIPCHNHDLEQDAVQNTGRIGGPLSVRKHRDRLINSLTRTDIEKPGTPMENPLIGKIPSREEIQKELNDLVASM